MEAAELPRAKQRYQEDAQSERADIARVSQFKIANTADEDIADDDIEKAPKHIDGRRGEPLSRRLCERTLKRPPHHAADKMRGCVREEGAAKEIGQVRKPRHFRHPLFRADR